jgi:hypothetical protein
LAAVAEKSALGQSALGQSALGQKVTAPEGPLRVRFALGSKYREVGVLQFRPRVPASRPSTIENNSFCEEMPSRS